MSWPVPGTLMIEPTECEAKAELDRFCDAMIAIREEIRGDRAGPQPDRGQPAASTRPTPPTCCWRRWTAPTPGSRPPSRLPGVREDKYWPPVGRVDNAYGDRNLVCTCPPMEDYQQAAE